MTPKVTGTVTSYSVSPALPAGLTLNTTTGVISGAPTNAAAWNDYLITATNASGSTKGNVEFEILTGLYLSSYYSLTAGVAASIAPMTAGESGVPVWSITPALPAGLSLSSTDGKITGTPAASLAATKYTISLTILAATSTASLTLAITAAPLFDLGHTSAITFAAFSASALLTQDSAAHWVLWNYAADTDLANGTTGFAPTDNFGASGPLPVDLEGSTAVIQTPSTLKVLAAADGRELGVIQTVPSWWKLASDGSYICAGSTSGLTVWSPTGSVIFTRSGNYSNAIAFAAPGQVQVAQGAAGANVIETVTVPGGASSVGPTFQGQFQSWFVDGGKFITALNSTAWVYSNAWVQQDVASLPSTLTQLAGLGNWYWIINRSSLVLYAVGSKGVANSSYSLESPPGSGIAGTGLVVPSANISSLAILVESTTLGSGQVSILSLAGATPALSSAYPTPIDQLTSFAANSATTWIVGNVRGVLFDGASAVGQPRYIDYGQATGITGSMSNAVVATASGRILYFDAGTLALQGTINERAWQIAESADGMVLAAATGSSDYSTSQPPLGIDLYSLPGGATIGTFATPLLTSISLSAGGSVLEENFYPGAPCLSQAIAVPGGASIWCGASSAGITAGPLSPDGTLVATTASSQIYKNGVLVTAVQGTPVVWIDDNTLLANNYVYDGMTMSYNYTGASLYNAAGQLQGSPPLPNLGPVQVVSPTSLYDGPTNAIYSLTNGSAIWASGSPITQQIVQSSAGVPIDSLWEGVAGAYVIFESGNVIVAEPSQP